MTAPRAGAPTTAPLYAALHRLPRAGIEEPVGPELDLARLEVPWRPALVDGDLYAITGPVAWSGIPEPAELVALWTGPAGGELRSVFDVPPVRLGGSLRIGELRAPAPVALTRAIAGLELPDAETGIYLPAGLR